MAKLKSRRVSKRRKSRAVRRSSTNRAAWRSRSKGSRRRFETAMRKSYKSTAKRSVSKRRKTSIKRAKPVNRKAVYRSMPAASRKRVLAALERGRATMARNRRRKSSPRGAWAASSSRRGRNRRGSRSVSLRRARRNPTQNMSRYRVQHVISRRNPATAISAAIGTGVGLLTMILNQLVTTFAFNKMGGGAGGNVIKFGLPSAIAGGFVFAGVKNKVRKDVAYGAAGGAIFSALLGDVIVNALAGDKTSTGKMFAKIRNLGISEVKLTAEEQAAKDKLAKEAKEKEEADAATPTADAVIPTTEEVKKMGDFAAMRGFTMQQQFNDMLPGSPGLDGYTEAHGFNDTLSPSAMAGFTQETEFNDMAGLGAYTENQNLDDMAVMSGFKFEDNSNDHDMSFGEPSLSGGYDLDM